MNLQNFAKSSHNSDCCLSLTQDSHFKSSIVRHNFLYIKNEPKVIEPLKNALDNDYSQSRYNFMRLEDIS